MMKVKISGLISRLNYGAVESDIISRPSRKVGIFPSHRMKYTQFVSTYYMSCLATNLVCDSSKIPRNDGLFCSIHH